MEPEKVSGNTRPSKPIGMVDVAMHVGEHWEAELDIRKVPANAVDRLERHDENARIQPGKRPALQPESAEVLAARAGFKLTMKHEHQVPAPIVFKGTERTIRAEPAEGWRREPNLRLERAHP